MNSIGVNYINASGHTVRDSLLITILRSHSTVKPDVLGDTFAGQSRFPGDQVDPRGRRGADSPCMQHLYNSRIPVVPLEWKHMFCHTSVQAVCHHVAVMCLGTWRPNINAKSGLFTKRCQNCRSELKTGPLHALILIAFHVANSCLPGENLFGMIACLVCLLVYRVDPCDTAEISIPALFGHR